MKRKIYWSRGIFKLISILILLNVFLLSIFGLPGPANATKEGEFIEVIVNQNDTLWSIAHKYNQQDIDIRKLVYQIKELNKTDYLIYPGQILYIPLP